MSNLKLKAMPHNFEQAEEFLGNTDSKKLGHNTNIYRNRDGDILVRYHWTDIVIFHHNGNRVTYNNGGYGTPTTRNRLHMLSPSNVRFGQKNHKQTLTVDDVDVPFDGRITLSFRDGETSVYQA